MHNAFEIILTHQFVQGLASPNQLCAMLLCEKCMCKKGHPPHHQSNQHPLFYVETTVLFVPFNVLLRFLHFEI